MHRLFIPFAFVLAVGVAHTQEPEVRFPSELEWKLLRAGGAADAPKATLEFFDVRDLLTSDFPMKPFNTPQTETPEQRRSAARARAEQRLLARVMAHVTAKRESTDGVQIEYADRSRSTLLARGSTETIDAVRGYLNRLRSRAFRAYQVTCRVFRIVDAKATLPAVLAGEPIGEKDIVFVVRPEQMKPLLAELEARAKKRDNVEPITAPRLTLMNEQLGNAMTVSQRRYVVDYKVLKVLGGEEFVIDPQVETLETGLGLEFRVVLSEDEKFCTLESFYQLARLREPIEIEQSDHGPIHRPVIDASSLRFTVTTPLGGHVLVASKAVDRLGVFLLLISVDEANRRPPQRARVRAVSPGAGTASKPVTIFIDAGHARGLAAGTRIEFRAGGKTVCAGQATRVWDDVAEVTVDAADGVDFANAATWRATFEPSDATERKAVK